MFERHRTCCALALVAAATLLSLGCGEDAAADNTPIDVTGGGDVNEEIRHGGDATGNDGTRLRVVTFNVLCSMCPKAENDPWKDRVPHLQALIKEYDADILGVQELVPRELAIGTKGGDEPGLMVATHPVYVSLYWQATTTDASFSTYPDAVIYLRKSRFEVLDSGTYWLGPKPDEPLSEGFLKGKPTLSRLVVWATVKDKWSGRKLYVANTHFDPNSPSQELSAPLVMGRLPKDKSLREHAIIVGDFNAKPDRDAYKTIVAAQADGVTLREAYPASAAKDVVHNADKAPVWEPKDQIDHIFVGPKLAVSKWMVDMKKFGPNKRFPSDHRLIAADLKFLD